MPAAYRNGVFGTVTPVSGFPPGTLFTLTLPPDVQAGDLLVAFVHGGLSYTSAPTFQFEGTVSGWSAMQAFTTTTVNGGKYFVAVITGFWDGGSRTLSFRIGSNGGTGVSYQSDRCGILAYSGLPLNNWPSVLRNEGTTNFTATTTASVTGASVPQTWGAASTPIISFLYDSLGSVVDWSVTTGPVGNTREDFLNIAQRRHEIWDEIQASAGNYPSETPVWTGSSDSGGVYYSRLIANATGGIATGTIQSVTPSWARRHFAPHAHWESGG